MNEYIAPPPPWYLASRYAMRLTVGAHSVRHVRRIVRSFLREWGMAELTDAVELGVSELLSNVVRHVPDRRCFLVLLRQAAGVRVEVADRSEELPAVPGDLVSESESGRGLVLLGAVADRRGVTPEPLRGGKTVWFECGKGEGSCHEGS
ncbi:ATP-binding protein [Streptomyces sp. NPDC051041]|uniref:ATP-binding protein n=1 Tax=Streptomyces sp. NPDC051041 TaxID=3365640 RepID=UPI003798B707